MKYYAADFETTVYKNQTFTEVWAAAIVEFNTENVKVFNSIETFFNYIFFGISKSCIIYFHNLKFDGEFILHYLINVVKFRQALMDDEKTFKEKKQMNGGEFRYSISDRGMWYSIYVKAYGITIEFRDSYKMLPLKLKDVGESFKTKHQKLEMEYEGLRKAYGSISKSELEYIKNDVLVLKEAMEIMHKEGHTALTIGACALEEFKKTVPDWDLFFPDLSKYFIDSNIYGACTADEYIRRSLHGGWCYLNPEYAEQIIFGGYTLDVNSLYPSVMHSESGNRYPVGLPHFWVGQFPPMALQEEKYFFVTIRCKFKLKLKHLPTIQIKGDILYRSNEWLTTSNVFYKKDGKYHSHLVNGDGNLVEVKPTLTITKTDFKLFMKHYDVMDLEILHGCYFDTEIGIFDAYINKYREIKENSTGARRQISKLFLNSLYGKMAASTLSSYKIAYMNEGHLAFRDVAEYGKKPGYIPCGASITSYARYFTITAAQQNYDTFIYSDTDSLHLEGDVDQCEGVIFDKKKFNCWKHESSWEKGKFIRQKTYVEYINGVPNVVCAGMSETCKELFIKSLNCERDDHTGKAWEKLDDAEKAFLMTKRDINDFDRGLIVPGKLIPKHIPGGVILTKTTFEIK